MKSPPNKSNSIYNFLVRIEKRQRFVISTLLITIIAYLFTFVPFHKTIFVVPFLALIVYIVVYFAVLEDINKIEFFTLFALPIYYVISFYLFYYLLPDRLFAKIPYFLILGTGTYSLLLTINILNVGVERSLPLYRAAFSIGNFITLLVLFLLFTVLFSFKLHFLFNAFIGGLLAWPLFFQGIWMANPREVLEERVFKFATIITVLLAFSVLILNFIPIKASILSLFTVAIAYVMLGTTQEVIHDTVFKERIREYLIVFTVMFVMVLLTASWG